ncbi:MAG: CooT family nickel-binding protein [Methanoregula sp.]|jgi:predicted RNA-binding protein|uniref:CooT family nickel-binding protein n=1 Tax=Methanoregula sp. TaxID=2052170 RepID=UPI0025DE88B8|nr:CooT family nickel-binding protein [Methanoregula sp.]MCK9632370.1 CooT family nickel-binding protein [Methanoregula sp.]
MCEFTVILEESGEKKKIAENVVKARRKEGIVVLTNASGSLSKVEGATIEVVDTLMQELVLKKA